MGMTQAWLPTQQACQRPAAAAAHQCVQLVQHGQHELQLVSWLSEVDEHILAQQLLTNLIVTAPAGGEGGGHATEGCTKDIRRACLIVAQGPSGRGWRERQLPTADATQGG